EVRDATQEGAYLQGLERVIQFLVEDAKMERDCISLVSNHKNIAEWINGKEETSTSLEARLISCTYLMVLRLYSSMKGSSQRRCNGKKKPKQMWEDVKMGLTSETLVNTLWIIGVHRDGQ
ncbi:hypothetical protein PIB30_104806, partial [Stylosanthes scabra]|nr:hypothetical protein [Stylosanthes scabra]